MREEAKEEYLKGVVFGQPQKSTRVNGFHIESMEK